jgi:hypothetical protein
MTDTDKKAVDLIAIMSSVPLPDYADANARSDIGKHNDAIFGIHQNILQQKLSGMPLSEAR